MTRPALASALKLGAVALVWLVFLLADKVWMAAPGWPGWLDREVLAALRDPQTQEMIFLCLAIYYAAFLFLRRRRRRDRTGAGQPGELAGRWRMARPDAWLAAVMLASAACYLMTNRGSLAALILIGGVVLGQGAAAWAESEGGNEKWGDGIPLQMLAVPLLVILLAVASVCGRVWGAEFAYTGHIRWVGPWDNPNIYGLLMGTGAVLSAGLALAGWNVGRSFRRQAGGRLTLITLWLAAAMLMVWGLAHSYSRGAWGATGCGLACLAWHRRQSSTADCQGAEFRRWFIRNRVPAAVILAAVLVLCFWQFRQVEWHPLRRALSAANPADFSWRNRITAWEGAWQIMAEHPWLGTGWDQSESWFEHYYRPAKLTESAAIQMNDYLTLGVTLGGLALFCLAMYLWLILGGRGEIGSGVRGPGSGAEGQKTASGQAGKREKAITKTDWLRTTCHAGAVVLLVGFWFDGGLFKLPTAATFWVLLELGRVAPPKPQNS